MTYGLYVFNTCTIGYRKHFSLSNDYKGKSLYIYFEGIYRDCQIYINGEFVGNHASGYTSFY